MKNNFVLFIILGLFFNACEIIPLPEYAPETQPAIINNLTGTNWLLINENGVSPENMSYLIFTTEGVQNDDGEYAGDRIIRISYDDNCNKISERNSDVYFFTKKNLNAMYRNFWLSVGPPDRVSVGEAFFLTPPADIDLYDYSFEGDSLILDKEGDQSVYVSVDDIMCSSCEEIPCENGGTFNDATCECDCPEGWTGPDCSTPVPDTADCDIPCENGYIVTYDGCNCICEEGWTGVACDEQIAVLQDVSFPTELVEPRGISADLYSNIYIADAGNNEIYKITYQGQISTIVGSEESLNQPRHAVADPNGNVYIADMANHRIMHLSSSGALSVYAGGTIGNTDGKALSEAQFNNPAALALDIPNSRLYVADASNNKIRMITLTADTAQRMVSTLAGGLFSFFIQDGIGEQASLNNPAGLAYDSQEEILYFTDWGYDAIRQVDVNTAEVVTLISPGQGVAANMPPQGPAGITLGNNGSIYFADFNNHVIRRIDKYENFYFVSEVVGFYDMPGNENGIGTSSRLHRPYGVQFTQVNDGNTTSVAIYISDVGNAQLKVAKFQQ